MQQDKPVKMPCPGSKTRVLAKIFKGLFFVLLGLSSSLVGLPINAQATSNPPQSSSDAKGPFSSQLPRMVRADEAPDLSMPKTVVSSVDGLIGAGGIVQASSQNLTLYNLDVRMRLLGGISPHDDLLNHNGRVLSPMFWRAEAEVGSAWLSLQPVSSNLTFLGTNRTGTFVQRAMRVGTGQYTGVLNILYQALPAGRLKWELQFTPASTDHYRLVYDWWNLTENREMSPSTRGLKVEYSSGNYSFAWNDVPNGFATDATIAQGSFSLAIDLGIIEANSTSRLDPSLQLLLVGDCLHIPKEGLLRSERRKVLGVLR